MGGKNQQTTPQEISYSVCQNGTYRNSTDPPRLSTNNPAHRPFPSFYVIIQDELCNLGCLSTTSFTTYHSYSIIVYKVYKFLFSNKEQTFIVLLFKTDFRRMLTILCYCAVNSEESVIATKETDIYLFLVILKKKFSLNHTEVISAHLHFICVRFKAYQF